MAYTNIDLPTDYFNTVLYTGTGASNAITGVGFKPDFTWIKDRSNARDHQLVNAVVGYPSGTLFSNVTDAEYTAFPRVDSSNADGFTVSTPAQVNNSGETYVAWNWLANNTAGSSNTAGTIASTVAANTTSGFSICTLTTNAGGSGSYGHGLGVAPSFIIQKSRTNVTDWYVYHKSLGASAWLELNKSNGAITSNTAVWSGTAPSSTVVNLGSGWVNSNHGNVVAYCFAEVKGFSKFGSYTGNGSADGTFIYTGFKPSFVMVKRSDSTGSWLIHDNKRNTFNVANLWLGANLNNAETTSSDESKDFLSNGWKIRGTGTAQNTSGGTYIYMAFASNPFVTSGGIPTTAR
jgi:hypothetical protein